MWGLPIFTVCFLVFACFTVSSRSLEWQNFRIALGAVEWFLSLPLYILYSTTLCRPSEVWKGIEHTSDSVSLGSKEVRQKAHHGLIMSD